MRLDGLSRAAFSFLGWGRLGALVQSAYLQFQLEAERHVQRCSEKLKEENSGIQNQE